LADTWNENLCNMDQTYISNSLIFIVTTTILTGENLNNSNNPNDTYLLYYVITIHYHIKLSHLMSSYDSYLTELLNLKDKYSFDFYGEFHTTINILKFTQYIKLHKLNLNIHWGKITLIKNNGITYEPKNYLKIFKTNLLEFRFFNVLSPGLYTLKIEFLVGLTESSSKKFFKSFFINKENGIAWVNIK